ncbi:MAG: aminodeoxychorismate/anthranilate synthase component II [Cytophagales bacterium]|nr:aminodeoxychorismate/anthranilate synthase component II [Cytophagales bacterium]
MKILVLDNYDSFTYNLVHLVKKLGYDNVDVIRNDKIAVDDVFVYDKIILSPGPGIPIEAGILMPLIHKYAATKPILGVCLGHQAIGQSFGGELYNIQQVMHGKAIATEVISDDYIFADMPTKFVTGRYHSWAIRKENLPNHLTVTALDDKGIVMGLKHNIYDVRGVQFHPESVMTEYGEILMKNWLKH